MAERAHIPQQLSELEAKVLAMQTSHGPASLFAEQTRGLVKVASAVHEQEVLDEQVKVCQSIATVVQRGIPFTVDYREDRGRVSLGWNFRDSRTDIPMSQIAHAVVRAEYVARTEAASKELDTALRYAQDNPVFKRKPFENPLGVQADQLGRRNFRFPAASLLLRIGEEVSDKTDMLNVSTYRDYDHLTDRGVERDSMTVYRRDYFGTEKTAARLALRSRIAGDDPEDVLYSICRELQNGGNLTVQDGYAYLYDEYILREKNRLVPAQVINEWLQRPSVEPITRGSFSGPAARA